MDLVQPCGSAIPTGIRTMTSSSGARIITKEEWANLKPRIEDLYLHENQTFPKVKHALEQEFGVSITPRQFKRKIEDWGFKKNFRKHEKEQIIKAGPLGGILAHDRRVNKIRIDRLRRRNGIEILPSEISVINDIEMEDSNIGPNRQDETDTAPSVVDQSFTPDVHMIEETPEDRDMTTEDAVEDCNMATEAPSQLESPKDILNRLSHDVSPDSRNADLFAELDIEYAMESTRLENQEEDVGEEQFISKSEFHNLSRSDGHKSTCMEMCLVGPSNRSQSNPPEMSSVHRTYHTARSRGAWSPLFEIDIFPLEESVNQRTQKSSGLFWKSLIVEYEEREGQLLKLQQTLPTFSAGIISTLERLTSIAFYQNFFDLEVFEQLLKARINEKTPCIYKIVEACLRLVNYCVENSESESVAQFHEELHSKIRNNWSEDNPLHLQSSYSMAYTLYLQGKLEEAEAMIRPVIRISLSNLGPYNDFTIKALRLLGVIYHDLDLLEEAGRLLRLSTDILEQRALDRTWWESSDELLGLLVKCGQYSQSISLCKHIITCLEANLGMNATGLIGSHAYFAQILRKQLKIPEAITFLREALHKFEGISESVGFLYHELALCLACDDDLAEAANYYRKALKVYVVSFKWEWTEIDVINVCEKIGSCYEELGKYNDAAVFYGRVLEKLYSYKVTTRTQEAIEKVQYWLDEALEQLEPEEGTGNEKKRATDSKAVKGSVAEKHKSNDDRDTEVIDPEGVVRGFAEEDWDEIFGWDRQVTEFSIENLGLSEEFMKLDISQS
ncbi:Transcription factor protein [Rutstroemia sp. NJR-2017a BBW]|nr:Transcription factor protein [Rutstroemia sp. NJR-2017a BBW]